MPAATVATWIYLPGDAVKVVIAALVARGVHAAYPGLLGRRAPPERAAEGSLGCLSRPGLGAAADPVAAFRAAHAAGDPVALRTSGSPGAPRAVVRSTRVLGRLVRHRRRPGRARPPPPGCGCPVRCRRR